MLDAFEPDRPLAHPSPPCLLRFERAPAPCLPSSGVIGLHGVKKPGERSSPNQNIRSQDGVLATAP